MSKERSHGHEKTPKLIPEASGVFRRIVQPVCHEGAGNLYNVIMNDNVYPIDTPAAAAWLQESAYASEMSVLTNALGQGATQTAITQEQAPAVDPPTWEEYLDSQEPGMPPIEHQAAPPRYTPRPIQMNESDIMTEAQRGTEQVENFLADSAVQQLPQEGLN